MAGIVFVVLDPSNFWTQFACSEVINFLSSILKEGLRMVIKVQREAKSSVKHFSTAIKQSWEVCLPFRQSLLMSWCNSSERESERAKHNKVPKSEKVELSCFLQKAQKPRQLHFAPWQRR